MKAIQVAMLDREFDDIETHLETDIARPRNGRDPKLSDDLVVSRPEYATHSKAYFDYSGDIFEVLTYIDPGPGSRFVLSVRLISRKIPDLDDDAAQAQVVRSLRSIDCRDDKRCASRLKRKIEALRQ